VIPVDRSLVCFITEYGDIVVPMLLDGIVASLSIALWRSSPGKMPAVSFCKMISSWVRVRADSRDVAV